MHLTTAVHADVLKMAVTKEKRERIKWFHARDVFFGRADLSVGLQLARECEHEDARFLVSLFPEGAPATSQEALRVFLEHDDEPCCLCWAAMSRCEEQEQLLQRSAEAGYAWGQAHFADWDRANAVAWLEKAVAQGEPEAMSLLAELLRNGLAGEADLPRAECLWREAAWEGDAFAQHRVAELYYGVWSTERVVWLRRAAMQESRHGSLFRLILLLPDHLELFAAGASRRAVFESGAALAFIRDGKSAVRA